MFLDGLLIVIIVVILYYWSTSVSNDNNTIGITSLSLVPVLTWFYFSYKSDDKRLVYAANESHKGGIEINKLLSHENIRILHSILKETLLRGANITLDIGADVGTFGSGVDVAINLIFLMFSAATTLYSLEQTIAAGAKPIIEIAELKFENGPPGIKTNVETIWSKVEANDQKILRPRFGSNSSAS